MTFGAQSFSARANSLTHRFSPLTTSFLCQRYKMGQNQTRPHTLHQQYQHQHQYDGPLFGGHYPGDFSLKVSFNIAAMSGQDS